MESWAFALERELSSEPMAAPSLPPTLGLAAGEAVKVPEGPKVPSSDPSVGGAPNVAAPLSTEEWDRLVARNAAVSLGFLLQSLLITVEVFTFGALLAGVYTGFAAPSILLLLGPGLILPPLLAGALDLSRDRAIARGRMALPILSRHAKPYAALWGVAWGSLMALLALALSFGFGMLSLAFCALALSITLAGGSLFLYQQDRRVRQRIERRTSKAELTEAFCPRCGLKTRFGEEDRPRCPACAMYF